MGMFTEFNSVDISESLLPSTSGHAMHEGWAEGWIQHGSHQNFELKADRDRAMKQLEEKKAMLVVDSPPCTYFSDLQELNKHNMRRNEEWLARFHDNLIKAIDHINFCVKLYWKQMNAG